MITFRTQTIIVPSKMPQNRRANSSWNSRLRPFAFQATDPRSIHRSQGAKERLNLGPWRALTGLNHPYPNIWQGLYVDYPRRHSPVAEVVLVGLWAGVVT